MIRKKKSASTDTPGKAKPLDLENQPWYHGVRTRTDVGALLKNNGDWLVRASMGKNKVEIVLNMLTADGLDNLTIKCVASDEFALQLLYYQWEEKKIAECPKFKSMFDLCAYYTKHRLPNNKRLVKPIHRPFWLIKNDLIDYEAGNKLGSGNFCDVYKGKMSRRGEMTMVAIKLCHPPAEDVDKEALAEARVSMMNEAKLMSAYKHKNVIQFFGVACDRPPIMIVMEFCAGGSLEGHLKKRGPDISPSEKTIYCIEAARGMRYLHAQDCIHRDLASRNCLISGDGTIKIADFGLSKILSGTSKVLKEPVQCAPMRWMAPECMQRIPEFSVRTDVWSFGVLMYEIYSNADRPFSEVEDDRQIVRAIKKAAMPPPPEATPKTVAEVLAMIWVRDPESRPSFTDIVKLLVERSFGLPPISADQMLVNKLKGVTRTAPTVFGDEVLKCDSVRVTAAADAEAVQSAMLFTGDEKETSKRGKPGLLNSIYSLFRRKK